MPRKSKRRFRKRRNMKGGTNKLAFAKPEVNQTTSSGAIQGAMYDQKENNTDLTNINKEMAIRKNIPTSTHNPGTHQEYKTPLGLNAL